MQQYYISQVNLLDWFKRLLNSSMIIAPVNYEGRNTIENITFDNINQINLKGFRSVEPFKAYLFRIRESVANYFGQDSQPDSPGLVIIGARGCDLEAIEIQDKVFLSGDFCDSQYQANRDKLLLIGSDCSDCGQTCFCTLVDGQPYPTKGYDINISSLNGGALITVASDKGERVIQEHLSLFGPAKDSHKNEAQMVRQSVISQLEQLNQPFTLKKKLFGTHQANLRNPIWKKLTKDCIECSACNLACPSCSCFLLLDEKSGANYQRTKVWDACLKNGYARVAGGANSRPKLYERLKNRYHCKFDYSFERLQRYTCVGCGRCIDGCAGNIDMRKIFVELESQAPLTAQLE